MESLLNNGLSNLRIENAALKHIPEVCDIYNSTIDDRIATSDTKPKSLGEMSEAFTQLSAKFPYLVATIDRKVVGYAYLYPFSNREGYKYSAENAVYVRKDYRKHGLGKALLKELLIKSKELNFHYILAKVFSHNHSSIALHQTQGFKIIGTQKEVACMDNKYFDVVLLEKLINE